MRTEQWDIALMDVIAQHRARPYQPGSHDCFMLALDVIEALTGNRPYADVSYATDAGAVREMRKRGFASLGDAMVAVLPVREPGHAMRGDIAVIATQSQARDTLGVVIGATVLVRIADRFDQVPLTAARMILATG